MGVSRLPPRWPPWDPGRGLLAGLPATASTSRPLGRPAHPSLGLPSTSPSASAPAWPGQHTAPSECVEMDGWMVGDVSEQRWVAVHPSQAHTPSTLGSRQSQCNLPANPRARPTPGPCGDGHCPSLPASTACPSSPAVGGVQTRGRAGQWAGLASVCGVRPLTWWDRALACLAAICCS